MAYETFQNQYGSYSPTNFTNQFVNTALNSQYMKQAQWPLANFSNAFVDAVNNPVSPSTFYTGAYPTQGNVQNTPQVLGVQSNQPPPGPKYYSGDTFIPAASQGSTKEEIDAYNKAQALQSGYNSYFAELDRTLNESLPLQRSLQESTARNSYQSGLADLTSQRDTGLADLDVQAQKVERNKIRTLKDIANNIQNLMQAGNVYLGSRGAGDSSAANMYTYALTRMGNRQRGDVVSQAVDMTSQIEDKKFKLNNIFNTESNKLRSNFDSQINQIAIWFAQAQDSIRQQKSSAQAQLSQQALNYAISQLQQAQQQHANLNATLQSWAISKSADIDALRKNMASISQYTSPGISYTPLSFSGLMQGQTAAKTYYPGYGYLSTDEAKRIGLV